MAHALVTRSLELGTCHDNLLYRCCSRSPGIHLPPDNPVVWMRAALTTVALAGMLLLFQTGERGARLVYEYGVGVGIPGARR